jgi:hypothetical protein
VSSVFLLFDLILLQHFYTADLIKKTAVISFIKGEKVYKMIVHINGVDG